MDRKTIIITGGGGFLGTNLIKYLFDQDTNIFIVVIDNWITGSAEVLNDYLTENDLHDVVDVMNCDICNPKTIEMVMNTYKEVHEIYHFASLASPPFYKKYPLETLDVGYIGTKNMLELCRYYKDKGTDCRLLFSSTSEVYGDALEHPQKETYYGNVNTWGERSCYDESKRVAETLVYTYNNLFSLNAKVVRIFNTFGPFMNLNDGRIVTEVIRCLHKGGTLRIFGDGTQTRSLNYVDNTIRMIHKTMHSDVDSPVNVGSDQEMQVNDIVELIEEKWTDLYGKLPSTYKKVYCYIDKDDPKQRKPCLEFNRNSLGKLDCVSVDEGVKNTIVYFVQSMST